MGDALFVTADDGGRRPVFRVTPDADNRVRLTGDDGVYGDLVAAPDGSALYALRSAIDAPPGTGAARPGRARPATGAAARPGRAARSCPAPSPRSPRPPPTARRCAPGSRSPTATAPAPLLLWIHGGPLGSWNAWQWRWNPWLMAARGYAVLLPDPALSTGYGRGVRRPRLGRVGRRALHRPHGAHRRRRGPPRHRRRRRRRDGRLVRRLHGQLGGGPHRPVPRDRHPRQPVGARRLRPHDRRPGLLAPRDDPRDGGAAQPAPARRRDHHADPRRARRQGLPGADRRGAARSGGTSSRPGTATPPTSPTGSCTSPTRTTGSSRRSTPCSGTRRCWRSSTTTCADATGSVPELLR